MTRLFGTYKHNSFYIVPLEVLKHGEMLMVFVYLHLVSTHILTFKMN